MPVHDFSMPIRDFSVGDRVLCVAEAPSGNEFVHGLTGTVCSRTGSKGRRGRWIGVCWDVPVPYGHDCDGTCEAGRGFFVWEEDVTEEPAAVFDICPEDALAPSCLFKKKGASIYGLLHRLLSDRRWSS